MTRSSPTAAAALAVLLACSSRVLESSPRPTAIVPSVGRQGAETPVSIRGNGFRALPYQDADGAPRLDATFRVTLDGTELTGVTWLNETELRARVPPGLVLGAHRLEVRAPDGVTGGLDGAFTTLPGGVGPVLSASATVIPGVTEPSRPVTLRVTATNVGDVTVLGVGLSLVLTGNALAPPASTPAPVDLAPGAAHEFVVVLGAVQVGRTDLEVDVAGTDPDTGGVVAAPRLHPGPVVVQAGEVTQVAVDPFGDGTPYSYVFGYAGHVFLGPSRDGRGVVACQPDGTGFASYALGFHRDVTGSALLPDLFTSVSENDLCPELTTLGSAPACNPVSPQTTPCACGPDYEAGRGVLGSVTLGGVEWLAAMGRVEKAGHLGYLYMTRDTTSPLWFSYVDLYTAMPSGAMATSAVSMAALDDRLYVGLQVDGLAEKPRLVVLTRTPEGTGLDAGAVDAFATTLRQTAMDDPASGPSQIDALLGFEGRLFVANRRAVLVSKTGAPTGAPDGRTQFDDCTPPATGGWEATSIVRYTGKIDITPADRGVTAMAAWGGRLYLGRNTRPAPSTTSPAIPELWAFTPRHDAATGELLGCAPGDWQRIATNFGDTTSTAMTALFASASALYVGYDSPGGARLFRTTSPAPASEADFRGRDGCTAPCAPIGQAGLGDSVNTRFFDARAITFAGVDQVWATLGDGASAARVYRITE